MEDKTGSGHLEFQKLGEKAASEHMWFSQRPVISTERQHVEQLLIDLRQAREENKRLREDLAGANNRIGKMGFDFTKGYIFGTFALALTYIAIVAIFK